VPGVSRGGERFVCYQPVDGAEFIRTFRAIVKAASVQMSP
jgi:hypothetical protein